MNNSNLVDIKTRSTEKQREIRSKGGIASGVAKRKKKTIAEAVRTALEKNISDVPGLEKIGKKLGLTDEDDILSLTVQAIFLNEIKRGDFKSLKELTEILGEQLTVGTDEEKKQTELLTAIEKAVTGDTGGE